MVQTAAAGSSTNVEAPAEAASCSYYLLKAEPDSRIVKGKDVKFSVDDFEQVGTSPWEGVRNFEARNIMQAMKVGDKALFYHSNCKTPGVAAFAEVSKEAYPDYTAWDQSHPYYDPKSDEAKPKWFMVELTFKSRPKHFIPLALLKFIAASKGSEPPEGLDYLSEDDLQAVRGMDLVTRGRLSVQRVRKPEWDAIHHLAEQGGWEEWDLKKLQAKGPTAAGKRKRASEEDEGASEDENKAKPRKKAAPAKAKAPRGGKKVRGEPTEEEGYESPLTDLDEPQPKSKGGRKKTEVAKAPEGVRRSGRNRK
ncbi:PUA-like domain-containing protein [Coprinopsis sp. MPI-PUGE-AT-0042]|nr:PUA-like domain-containing protein [Coprinopsis sp. MPI-PUGE-AT-0042]